MDVLKSFLLVFVICTFISCKKDDKLAKNKVEVYLDDVKYTPLPYDLYNGNDVLKNNGVYLAFSDNAGRVYRGSQYYDMDFPTGMGFKISIGKSDFVSFSILSQLPGMHNLSNRQKIDVGTYPLTVSSSSEELDFTAIASYENPVTDKRYRSVPNSGNLVITRLDKNRVEGTLTGVLRTQKEYTDEKDIQLRITFDCDITTVNESFM